MEDGAGKTRNVETYNYEKFFDAMAAANTDKWDNDMFTTYDGDGMDNYPGQTGLIHSMRSTRRMTVIRIIHWRMSMELIQIIPQVETEILPSSRSSGSGNISSEQLKIQRTIIQRRMICQIPHLQRMHYIMRHMIMTT